MTPVVQFKLKQTQLLCHSFSESEGVFVLSFWRGVFKVLIFQIWRGSKVLVFVIQRGSLFFVFENCRGLRSQCNSVRACLPTPSSFSPCNVRLAFCIFLKVAHCHRLLTTSFTGTFPWLGDGAGKVPGNEVEVAQCNFGDETLIVCFVKTNDHCSFEINFNNNRVHDCVII